MKRQTILLVSALLLTPAVGLAADNDAQVHDAHSAFEVLKSLEGEWRGVVEQDSEEPRETTVTYRVSALGHSVIQTFAPGQPYEMFSVYHMDGDELLMTHYCAIGNAPKMKFKATGEPGQLAFEFNGGTNFDPATDAHAHEGSMQILGPDTYRSRSIGYSGGKPTPPRHFNMQRVSSEP